MDRRWWCRRRDESGRRLCPDGGEPEGEDGTDRDDDGESDGPAADATEATDAPPDDTSGGEAGGSPGLDRSNVEVTEAGKAEPADPKWEKPDPDDIPEFETGADEPLTKPQSEPASADRGGKAPEDPTEGMPNEARSPGSSRIKREGTDAYVAALELCARLPEDIRLPEQAAEIVPAAVEAELEQDVQAFTASEFDEHSPTVETLDFVERDGDIWLRIRLGVPSDAFDDLDPEAVRAHALQELEGVL